MMINLCGCLIIGGKEKNKHQHKKTQGTQGRSTKTKTPVVGMRSRGGMLVAAKMDKVNSASTRWTFGLVVPKFLFKI
jgi:hypothetical protein